jgi:hypothetical protein
MLGASGLIASRIMLLVSHGLIDVQCSARFCSGATASARNCFPGVHTHLRNRSSHFVFDNGGMIWIWIGSSSSDKSQSLVEANGGFIVARDHQ